MKDNWTDFEKFVFRQFESLSKDVRTVSNRISKLEGRAASWGAVGGLVAVAIVKAIFHTQ